MRKYFFLVKSGMAFLVLMAAAWPISVSSAPAADGLMERYAKWTESSISSACQSRAAGVPSAGVQASNAYMEKCKETYSKVRDKAKDYLAKAKVSEAKFQQVMKTNGSCGSKDCYTNLANSLNEAKNDQMALKASLDSAVKEIDTEITKNDTALKELQADQTKLDKYAADQERQVPVMEQQNQQASANTLRSNAEVAKTVKNDRVSAISSQEKAKEVGEQFKSEAQSRSSYHTEQIRKLEANRSTLMTRAEKMPSVSSPVGVLPPSGTDGLSRAAVDPVLPVDNSTPIANSSSINGSSLGTTAASLAPGLAMAGVGAAAAMGATSSSASSASSTTPYANPYPTGALRSSDMNASESQIHGPSGSQFESGAGTNTSVVDGGVDGATLSEGENRGQVAAELSHSPAVSPQSQEEGSIGEATEQSAQGTSFTPGSSPIRASAEGKNGGGYSADGAKGAASGEGEPKTPAQTAAEMKNFKADLQAGAVSIAGSDVNAALADLAKEFSTDDLGLDLGLGLTAVEKASFRAGSVGDVLGKSEMLAANTDQRSRGLASEEENVSLFDRTKFTLVRAMKRGNLLLLKKKL